MPNFEIPSPTPPRDTPRSLFNTFDTEIDSLLGAVKARQSFQVDGSGLTAAVLDTGLRISHKCFFGRVPAWHNFTAEDNGDSTVVTDHNGHGTNVAGLISAGTNDERRGIAPGASVIPLKILPAPNLQPILDALNWVLVNAAEHRISVVNMSIGVPDYNKTSDEEARADSPELHKLLEQLSNQRIAVVVSAGNSYHSDQREGMSTPAIFREVISVGAVYDASVGPRFYSDGAQAHTTRSDQITPFSQRLSPQTNPECYTDVFSAGGSATSAGASSDDGWSTQDGTSQAAPTVAGVVLLLQQHYKRRTAELPEIDLLQDVLRSSSTWIVDGDDENDNVQHTGRKYPRVNAYESLVALDRYLKLNPP